MFRHYTSRKPVKTLKEARADDRVYEINKLDPAEFEDAKYEINLNDGYEFDESGGLIYCDSAKEVCDIINNYICLAFDVVIPNDNAH